MYFSKMIFILVNIHQFKWRWNYHNQNIVISLSSSFKCMIRVEFKEEFFEGLIRKLSDIYKRYMLFRVWSCDG